MHVYKFLNPTIPPDWQAKCLELAFFRMIATSLLLTRTYQLKSVTQTPQRIVSLGGK